MELPQLPVELWHDEILKYINDRNTWRSLQYVSKFFMDYYNNKYDKLIIEVKRDEINAYHRRYDSYYKKYDKIWLMCIEIDMTMTLYSLKFIISISDQYGWDEECSIIRLISKKFEYSARYRTNNFTFDTFKDAIFEINGQCRFQNISATEYMLTVLYNISNRYVEIFEEIEPIRKEINKSIETTDIYIPWNKSECYLP